MRQTICCAEWETRRAKAEGATAVIASPAKVVKPNKVALAVIKPFHDSSSVLDVHDPSVLKHVPRATGDLLRIWAPMFDLNLLNVDQGASDRADMRSDKQHRGSAPGGDVGSYSAHRRGGRGSGEEGRGMVEKVKNGVIGNSAFGVVAPGGGGKIRLLTRGEKLDP